MGYFKLWTNIVFRALALFRINAKRDGRDWHKDNSLPAVRENRKNHAEEHRPLRIRNHRLRLRRSRWVQ